MTDYRISDTYRKDTHHKAGHGYGRKTLAGTWTGERIMLPSSIVVHTTNNPNKGTKVWNEATFIRDSPDVSCHDLIGKDGTIYVILPPTFVAWHAGAALPAFLNARSIGFELHCSVGEVPTQAQKDALAWRVRQYITTYSLTAEDINTHRAVALPKGRKSDPEGFPDAEFYAWRDALFTQPDWEEEWGDRFAYRALWGIPTAYRDAYRLGQRLGNAISDELQADGFVMQCFQRGVITWAPGGGTKVHMIGKP